MKLRSGWHSGFPSYLHINVSRRWGVILRSVIDPRHQTCRSIFRWESSNNNWRISRDNFQIFCISCVLKEKSTIYSVNGLFYSMAFGKLEAKNDIINKSKIEGKIRDKNETEDDWMVASVWIAGSGFFSTVWFILFLLLLCKLLLRNKSKPGFCSCGTVRNSLPL